MVQANETDLDREDDVPSREESETVTATGPIVTGRRVAFYSGALVLAGLLGYLGFYYPKTVPPSPLTSLSAARLWLGLAQRFPDTDVGRKFRAEHLARADQELDQAERAAPGLAVTREFRAFRSWVDGDFDESARWYREAIAIPGNDTRFVNKMIINLAQVEVRAGNLDVAKSELDKVSVDSRDGGWHLASAKISQAKGDAASRSASLQSAFDCAKNADQKLLRVIADASFEWGDAIAASCYEQIENKDVKAWYRLARLKMATGDLDMAQNALSNVQERDPELLSRLLKADGEFWEPITSKGLLDNDRVGQEAKATPGK